MSEYRETSIGLFPKDWEVARFGSLFETQLGKMLSPKSKQGDVPKPYLRNKNVQWGSIELDDLLTMDFDDREKSKFLLREGDLLICEGGIVGRSAIWRGQLAECYYQKALHRVRPRSSEVTNEFLAFWFEYSFDVSNLYKIGGASSTIAHLPEVQLVSLPIPKPPLDEQRKIAAVLGKVQAAVAVEGDLVRVARELKQAALRQLFTRGLRGETQKETEIGTMPQSWGIVPFRTLFRTQLGKMLSPRAKQGEAPLPYLRNKNVQWGRIDVDDVLTMDFDARERAKFELRSGDLLICEGGVLGRCALWRGQINECYFQKALHRVRPLGAESSNEFLAYWLEHAFAFANVYRLGGASSTIAHLPAEQLLALPIPKPSPAEQREIAGLLATLDAKIAHHEARQGLWRELFRTLLHDLLTARRRVTSLDLANDSADVGKMIPATA